MNLLVDYNIKLFLTLYLDVVNINRDGFALGIIPMGCKNGLYDMKMDNLFRSLLVTPTIPTIKTSILWLPNLMASRIFSMHITLKSLIFSQIEEIQNKISKSSTILPK